MSITTKIEYCDSTLNLMAGCQGCELWNGKDVKLCYAGNMVERYKGCKGWPLSFDQPMIFPERMKQAQKWPDLTGIDRIDKPWLNGKRRVIFLNDMGDTFTKPLAYDWLDDYLFPDLVCLSATILFLTKRPTMMVELFKDWGYVPDNFWLGTTVTKQSNLYRLFQDLFEIKDVYPETKVWCSFEPLLGKLDLSEMDFIFASGYHRIGLIDWAVIGGLHHAPADEHEQDWIDDLEKQLDAYHVPIFLKDDARRREVPLP